MSAINNDDSDTHDNDDGHDNEVDDKDENVNEDEFDDDQCKLIIRL